MTLFASPLFIASIIVTVVAVIIQQRFLVLTNNLLETQKHLESTLYSEFSEIKSIVSVASSGIEQIFRSEGEIIKRLPRLLEGTQFRLDILRVNSLFWDIELQRSAARALQRGVKFRVLLVDPESPLLDYYASQEKRDSLSLFSELRQEEERWRELEATIGNIELRLHKGLVSMSLLLADNTMFAAPYISGKLVHSVPQTQLTNGPVFRAYEEYFTNCWEQSTGRSEP